MKRSQMINLIKQKLDGTPIDHDNYAEQFLQVIENILESSGAHIIWFSPEGDPYSKGWQEEDDNYLPYPDDLIMEYEP